MDDKQYQNTAAESWFADNQEPGVKLPIYAYRTVECHFCGNLVPEGNLPEHLMADVRIIKLIKSTRPEWNHKECEDYFRSLSGPRLD